VLPFTRTSETRRSKTAPTSRHSLPASRPSSSGSSFRFRSVAASVLGLLLLPMLTAATSMPLPPCLTQEQAHKRWPDDHLVWRTPSRCWTNNRHQHEFADPERRRPHPPPQPDPPDWKALPEKVAADVGARGVRTEIYFPSLDHGNILASYPLMLPMPWLSPEPMIEWPLLLDIDRTPFKAWDARVQ